MPPHSPSIRSFLPILLLTVIGTAAAQPPAETTLRIATFNLNDVRSSDLADANHPRLRRLAEVIQRLRPNILFLNEIAYDGPGAPGFKDGDTPGQNAQRFADRFLTIP